MAQPPDLIGCFWTLGGNYVFGENDHSPWEFRDRAQAAGRAGYRGVGLKHADLMATLGRHAFGDIRAILADNGLIHLELEALFDWYAVGEKRAASDRVRRDLLNAAAELGAHHVKAAGGFGIDATTDIVRMHDSFQALAAEARSAGTTMALEPIPFSNIRDLGTAFFILGDSAGAGAGVMLDSWHVARGRFSLADIATLPGAFIAGAELDDGTIETVGDPIGDTLDRRRLCGEGEVDLRGFIAAVQATGYDGPWGVEIISEEQRARPLDEAAQRSFETTAAQFPQR